MNCCQTTPSHYLNQCWLIISKIQCLIHVLSLSLPWAAPNYNHKVIIVIILLRNFNDNHCDLKFWFSTTFPSPPDLCIKLSDMTWYLIASFLPVSIIDVPCMARYLIGLPDPCYNDFKAGNINRQHKQAIKDCRIMDDHNGQWPLLLAWFNFNPSMDK